MSEEFFHGPLIPAFRRLGNRRRLDPTQAFPKNIRMTEILHRHRNLAILELPAEGALLDALDVIGETYGREVDWVAVPASRLPSEFFRLRSGVLGEFTQKLVNYRLKLAVLGDVSRHVEASEAFAAYVTETNRQGQLRFADDMPALLARLS